MKNYMMKTLLAVSAMAFAWVGGYNGQSVFAAGSTVYAVESTYAKYQKVTYTDAAGNDIPVMVLANESETEFNLQFDYYGVDANLKAEKTEDGQYRITNGDFFQTAGQNLIKMAVAQDNWTYGR